MTQNLSPTDLDFAKRQNALWLARAAYRNAEPNSVERDMAWKEYRDLLQAVQDMGEHK